MLSLSATSACDKLRILRHSLIVSCLFVSITSSLQNVPLCNSINYVTPLRWKCSNTHFARGGRRPAHIASTSLMPVRRLRSASAYALMTESTSGFLCPHTKVFISCLSCVPSRALYQKSQGRNCNCQKMSLRHHLILRRKKRQSPDGNTIGSDTDLRIRFVSVESPWSTLHISIWSIPLSVPS